MSTGTGALPGTAVAGAAAASPKWLGVRVFLRRKTAVLGVILVALNLLVALTAPALSRWDPQALDVKSRLSPPSAAHWFGTDEVGNDVYTRVVLGVSGGVAAYKSAALARLDKEGILHIAGRMVGREVQQLEVDLICLYLTRGIHLESHIGQDIQHTAELLRGGLQPSPVDFAPGQGHVVVAEILDCHEDRKV